MPLPNILITGTPGTGKTTAAQKIANALNFTYLNIGDIVKANNFVLSYDEAFDANVPDEDTLLDHLEGVLRDQNGYVLDYHSCELFPERWIAQHPQGTVIVLRTDTEVLYSRLEARKYSDVKVQENIAAEIMQVCFDEASESYPEEMVFEFQSNAMEDMEAVVAFVVQRVNGEKKDDAFEENATVE